MPIEFRCPQCQKLLRVPDESAGAKAKCPQCGAIADVPQPGAEHLAGAGDSAGGASRQDTEPFSEGAEPAVNPYSAPASGHAPVGPTPTLVGKVVPTPVDAGSVMSYAFEVWKANLGLLLGIAAVVLGVNFLFGAVQGSARDQGAEGVASMVSLISTIVQTFLGIGQAQIGLKLLRRQPASFGELFGGGPLFLPVFGASILAGFAMVFGCACIIVPGVLLLLYFWPFYWLLVDQKARVFESFGLGLTVAQVNIGTSFVLLLATFGLILAGVLAICVGLLFATPLVTLIWGAAYLMMTGQMMTKPQL